MNLRSAFVFAAGLALGTSAVAQPLPGGLPAVAARVTALETATTTLQGQVSALQTLVGTLQGQVTTLQGQLATLQNSTSSLQSALNAEIANRQSGDSALQSALDQEINARKAADAALQAVITASNSKGFSTYNPQADLVEGAPATVGSIGPLPAGNYAIVATASVYNPKNDADWGCFLVRDDTNVTIGRVTFGTTSPPAIGDVYGHSVNSGTIPALVTLPDNGRVHMTCSTGVAGSSLYDIEIVATSVATATIGCSNVAACQ